MSLGMGALQHTLTHESYAEDDPKKHRKGGGERTARKSLPGMYRYGGDCGVATYTSYTLAGQYRSD